MIEFRNVTKRYGQGGREVAALAGLSLTIGRGEFVSVTGPSGSGKSTFLHLAGGLDLPTVCTPSMSTSPLVGVRDDETGKYVEEWQHSESGRGG